MSYGTTSRRKNRTGFRSKTNRRNRTGVHDWAGWPEIVPAVVERLRGVCIECRPAIEVVGQQDGPDTLFYVDPPYPLSTRTAIRWPTEADRAYAHDLTDDDHRDLAAVLKNARGGGRSEQLSERAV